MKPVAVAGWGMLPVGRHVGKSPFDLAHEAALQALASARIRPSLVGGLYATPETAGGFPGFMFAARLAEHLGLKTAALGRYEVGGNSGAIALRHACQDVSEGRVDYALVVGAEKGEEGTLGGLESSITLAVHGLMSLYGPYVALYGVGTPLVLYAMGVQRYLHEHDVDPRAIATLPVVLRENALKNPWSYFKTPLTVEEVLASRIVSPPMHLLECSRFYDAGAAVVLTRPEIAGSGAVVFRAVEEHHDGTHFIPWEPGSSICSFPAAREASRKALATAGWTLDQVDFAEVHGVFAGTECMLYEDLGFFPAGKGAEAVAKGKTRLGGERPLNPSGGRLGLGYAPDPTPLVEVVEAVVQIRGEAGERQVRGARRALVHAEHGMNNGAAVFLLEAA